MVFCWHFNHSANGYPVAFNYSPELFPLSLLDEGHTGVALFMTLSGYLFAKLLQGKDIHFLPFIYNRVLRLGPLLLVALTIGACIELINDRPLNHFWSRVYEGAVKPTLPNGGWSITVELHYYLLLPLLLFLYKRSALWLPSLIICSLSIRCYLWLQNGEVQSLAYWTIIGRFDQFLFGMLAFKYKHLIKNQHAITCITLLVFSYGYWLFDVHGGFYNKGSYPSQSAIWIFLPSVEGFCYAAGIAWYVESFQHNGQGWLSRIFSQMGEFAYSIYLLHFFFVFILARFVHENIMDLSNFYVSTIWAVGFYFLMWPLGWLSMNLIERPFLKLRRAYIKK